MMQEVLVVVNGNWGKWDEWSSCSETCGNGTKTRKRYCNNPAPYNGGHICSGNDTEITDCFVEDCPGIVQSDFAGLRHIHP